MGEGGHCHDYHTLEPHQRLLAVAAAETIPPVVSRVHTTAQNGRVLHDERIYHVPDEVRTAIQTVLLNTRIII